MPGEPAVATLTIRVGERYETATLDDLLAAYKEMQAGNDVVVFAKPAHGEQIKAMFAGYIYNISLVNSPMED